MNEPAENVASPKMRRIGILDRTRRHPHVLRRSRLQGPVSAMPVVVIDVFGQHDLELTPTQDGPHGRGCQSATGSSEFAVDASIASGRVLHGQDDLHGSRWQSRSAGASPREVYRRRTKSRCHRSKVSG